MEYTCFIEVHVPFHQTMTIHIGYQGFVVHMHSGVVLVSNFFSGLHVPRVKETPSLGFSGDGLLFSDVLLNFRATTPINYRLN